MKYNSKYTLLISLIVALGGFLLGFDSAVISGAVPFIQKDFELTNIQLGWAVSCLILGAMAGNASAGVLSDKYGRKPILILTAVLFTLSAIFSALAPNFYIFIIARIIGGIGVGGAILIAPVYIAEIAPPEKRGRLVSFNQLNIVIGISVAYFSNYFLLETGINNWRWMLGVETIPAILYFSLLFIVPKSPRWLSANNQQDQAKAILEKIGGLIYAEKSLTEIKASLAQKHQKQKLSSLFDHKLSLIIFIGLGIAFFQQITGINAVFYYAPTIFEQAGGGTKASFMQAVIVGLTNLAFTLVAINLIDRLGRKFLLIVGTIGMTVALTVLAWSFNDSNYVLNQQAITELQTEGIPKNIINSLNDIKDQEFKSAKEFSNTLKTIVPSENLLSYEDAISKKAFNIKAVLVLICILLYVASFAVSLGPVMWALLSEIFPNYIRGIAISFVGFFNSLVSFSVTFVFPWELKTVGPSLTFLIYGLLAFLALLFTLKYIPETKGKSLEELESLLTK